MTSSPKSSKTTSNMKIRAARSDDLDAIKALLAENGLPVSDITADLLGDFAVAEDAGGSLVGSVGLELHGPDALVRSLAVARTARSAGLGSRLLAQVEQVARTKSVSDLWLLTMTASEFFGRAGYSVVHRSNAPAALRASHQFAELCAATAVCMQKKL
ncbi:arsenic resistance N-acetyltransferase ArsN2 [Paraburkholderia fungorum]|uniref:Arsenic resistance N-acetyltransferase ArsN2 n=1 Tax=Paraburkholderia fungorum TaxID=134537 RepID=A0AAP5QD00_9BURK|nr:arsenic resistance N-acetyltransferase ArsN2 [Paraburkholderia fungorum]MDT8840215.1 arsenic resistance N-acetyltransferase ArsN2 [Paraburkholderia fungorum]